MSVTVASAERSFSKLKLIKNYLRSTMTQERLTTLSTISIEEAILDDIDIWYISMKLSRILQTEKREE